MNVKIRHKDSASDLMKQIKQNFGSPKGNSYKVEKVAKRTKDTYAPVETKDIWKEDFERHREYSHKGLFCPSSVPYESIGDIKLHSAELLLEQLADCLPPKVIEAYKKGKQNQVAKPPEKEKEKKIHLTVKESCGDGRPSSSGGDGISCGASRREQDSAGMSDIKTMLEESRRRITAVRAGQAYVDHVKDCQTARAKLQELNAKVDDVTMELERLSSHYLVTNITTRGISLDPATDDGGKSGADEWKKPGATSYVGATKFFSGQSMKGARRLHSFINKLECIRTVMLSLLNLKSKHLRTKLPLTFDVVKTLRKGSIPSIYDRKMSLMRGRVSRPLFSSDTMHSRLEMKQLSHHPRKESTASNAVPTFTLDSASNKDWAKTSKLNISSVADSKTLTIPAPSKFNNLFRRKTKHLLTALHQDSPRVETWEDLMMAGTKINRSLKLLNPRRHPPWTPHLHDQKSTVGMLTRVHDPNGSQQPDEEGSQDFVLQKFMDEIWELKKNLRQDTLNNLAKLEREKLPIFRKVLENFDELHPLWEHQVRVFGRISDEISFNPDIILKDESITWYDALVQEGKNLANGQDIVEMNQILGKLEALCRYDFNVIPQAKEKMCLLTMSLPAFEICAFHMQSAITFVLKEVLQLNAGMLSQWLQIRGLPLCSGV